MSIKVEIEITPVIAEMLCGTFTAIANLEYITPDEYIILFNNANKMRDHVPVDKREQLDIILKLMQKNSDEFNKMIENSTNDFMDKLDL